MGGGLIQSFFLVYCSNINYQETLYNLFYEIFHQAPSPSIRIILDFFNI